MVEAMKSFAQLTDEARFVPNLYSAVLDAPSHCIHPLDVLVETNSPSSSPYRAALEGKDWPLLTQLTEATLSSAGELFL